MVFMVLALAASLESWQPDGKWRNYGPASKSCGKWIAEKENPEYRLVQYGWAGGFLSGINLANGGKLTETDPESLVAFVDQQCGERPLEQVAAITFEFFFRSIKSP